VDPNGRLPEVDDQTETLPGRGDGVGFTVGLGMANVGFYAASIGVVLVILANDLGLPVEQLAWFGSAFGYGLIVIAFVGPFALRLGPNRVLATAAAVLGAGSLLLALSFTPVVAYAGGVLQGLGAAGIVLVAPGLLRGPEAEAKLTTVNAAASIAGVCAPLLLGAATVLGVGGRVPLLLQAAAMVVLAIAAIRMRPIAPPAEVHPETVVLVKRGAARRWLAIVCAVSVEFCFIVWGAARLVQTGLNAGMAALVAAAFQVGMASGRVVGSRMIARLPMVLVGASLTAVGTLMVVLAPWWPVVGLGQLVAGFGLATLYPITLARLMATPGLRPELGASMGALASGTAITLAPMLLAAVAGGTGLQLAFLTALPLLGLLVWLHREPRRAVA
jgi:MFS family permease